MSGQQVHHGLEGVLAGESAVCEVDHASGGLFYRGYSIDALTEGASFEEVAYLLLTGDLPGEAALLDFQAALKASRPLPPELDALIKGLSPSVHPMDAVRTAVSFLGAGAGVSDPEQLPNAEENRRHAIGLLAKMPAILAALRPSAKTPSDPTPASHAAYLLSVLTGDTPDLFSVKVMNVSLILYAEHEFNASTFAARVTASTLSDLYAAVTSAIGTLKGPLHGGANEAVLKMLSEIGEGGDPERYILEKLDRKERVMGFGHRVLKREDPRSRIIKHYARALCAKIGAAAWMAVAEEIEEIMRREKGLYPNLDFYTALTYFLLGLPRTLYTPIFVCSRMAGWTAHIMEQYAHNRLFRPRARYIGPKHRPFIPRAKRG